MSDMLQEDLYLIRRYQHQRRLQYDEYDHHLSKKHAQHMLRVNRIDDIGDAGGSDGGGRRRRSRRSHEGAGVVGADDDDESSDMSEDEDDSDGDNDDEEEDGDGGWEGPESIIMSNIVRYMDIRQRFLREVEEEEEEGQKRLEEEEEQQKSSRFFEDFEEPGGSLSVSMGQDDDDDDDDGESDGDDTAGEETENFEMGNDNDDEVNSSTMGRRRRRRRRRAGNRKARKVASGRGGASEEDDDDDDGNDGNDGDDGTERKWEDNVYIDLVKFSALRNPSVALGDESTGNRTLHIAQTATDLRNDEEDNLTLRVRRQFSSQFRSLLNDRLFHDVIFVFPESGRRIFAHKAILILRSEYFSTMFSSGMHETSNNEIMIEGVDYPTFICMLGFIYTAELRVSPSTVIPLMACANQFQVDGIHSLLSDYIEKTVDKETVCYMLEEANFYSAESIMDVLLKFVDDHVEEVFNSHSLCILGPETLIHVLKRRTFDTDELKIFEMCHRWCHEHTEYLKRQNLENMRVSMEESLDDVDDDESFEDLATKVALDVDPQSLFEMVCPYIQWAAIDPLDLRDKIEFKYPGLVPKKYLLQAYRYQVTGELPRGITLASQPLLQNWTFDPDMLGSSLSLSNNNRTVEKGSSTSSATVVGNVVFDKKRRYFFAVKIEDVPPTSYVMVGVSDPSTIRNNLNAFLSHNPRGYAFYSYQPMKYHNSMSSTYGDPFHKGDEIGVMVDLKQGNIEFYKNGRSLGIAFVNVTGPLSPCVTLYSAHDKISIVRKPKVFKLRPLS